jgi:AcrR family transcriptional regulator
MTSTLVERRPRRAAAETRAHVLDVAEELFYADGIHATGIDKVAATAGVAPTTLYRLFASKDDLVAAYVERFAVGYREWIETVTSAPGLTPAEGVLALIDGLVDATASDGFRGCPFLMALAEYPDSSSAAHARAQEVKAWVRGKLGELARELPGVSRSSAQVVADQIALVVEGLYGSVAALGPGGPARCARALAALVLDSVAA